MKKRILIILAVLALLALIGVPAAAGPPTTVTVSWYEDFDRYHPNGDYSFGSWGEPWGHYLLEVEMTHSGKSYHSVAPGEFFINVDDVEGKLLINEAGHLSAHMTYTTKSGRPIKDLFQGKVTITDDGWLVGEYTQKTYVFATKAEVDQYYPNAVPAKGRKAKGWWFLSYTEYVCTD